MSLDRKIALMVVHLFDCNVLLVEPLQIVGVALAEKLMFVEMLARGIRFCLENSGIQCAFVVLVRAFQTSHQREAADTRSPSGEDTLEAPIDSTCPLHPDICSLSCGVRSTSLTVCEVRTQRLPDHATTSASQHFRPQHSFRFQFFI